MLYYECMKCSNTWKSEKDYWGCPRCKGGDLMVDTKSPEDREREKIPEDL